MKTKCDSSMFKRYRVGIGENVGVLHTYPGISSPEQSSVSTNLVRDSIYQSIFVNKAPTENDINELLTTKCTPMAGCKYPTNNRVLAGADPGFQVRGAHLRKLRRAEGGAKMFGVFRVKIHDFTPIKQITESPSYP
jgi:hypothetical protein